MTPKCGVCGWHFSERTLVKHAYTACGLDEEKAKPRPHFPEIDDIIRGIEESEANA